jgi:hypothetical protein
LHTYAQKWGDFRDGFSGPLAGMKDALRTDMPDQVWPNVRTVLETEADILRETILDSLLIRGAVPLPATENEIARFAQNIGLHHLETSQSDIPTWEYERFALGYAPRSSGGSPRIVVPEIFFDVSSSTRRVYTIVAILPDPRSEFPPYPIEKQEGIRRSLEYISRHLQRLPGWTTGLIRLATGEAAEDIIGELQRIGSLDFAQLQQQNQMDPGTEGIHWEFVLTNIRGHRVHINFWPGMCGLALDVAAEETGRLLDDMRHLLTNSSPKT